MWVATPSGVPASFFLSYIFYLPPDKKGRTRRGVLLVEIRERTRGTPPKRNAGHRGVLSR